MPKEARQEKKISKKGPSKQTMVDEQVTDLDKEKSNKNSQSLTHAKNWVDGKQKGLMLAIVMLSVFLIFSLIAIGTLGYFVAKEQTMGRLTLGDPVDVEIMQGGSVASTLEFPSNALPGAVYDQEIQIHQPNNTSDALVRAKLTITNGDNETTYVTITPSNEWIKGDDGYYYLEGVMKAGDSKDFVNQIEIPTTLTNENMGKTVSISIIVESIQYAHGAVREVWTTAPTSWLTLYTVE